MKCECGYEMYLSSEDEFNRNYRSKNCYCFTQEGKLKVPNDFRKMSEEFICTICSEDIDAAGGLPWQVTIAGHTLIVCYDCFKKNEEEENGN